MYQSSFLSFHFITQSLPLYSPESAPGLLGTLAGWEREVFLCPIFWTGYKFLGSKHNQLAVLFSAHLSPAFLSTCIPTDDPGSRYTQTMQTSQSNFWLKKAIWLPSAPIFASSHICKQGDLHPPRWACLFPLTLHTFCLMSDDRVSSLTVRVLAIVEFQASSRCLHRASASYLQPPVGHVHSNISQRIQIQHIINSTQHPSSLIRSG